MASLLHFMDLLARPGWIFDMDGTLTVPVHDFEAIRRELELPAKKPILEELAKMPVEEAAWRRERLDGIEEELARASLPAEGAVEFVRELQANGKRLGILTRNTQANARITLEVIGVLDAFHEEDVLGRDEAPPKPDPAGIEKLLQRWGLESSEAVMVGDYRFDLEAGRNAGTATVHVSAEGAGAWPEMTTLAVTSFGELSSRSQG